MMDRNYPCSSFADALASPAQTVASWAYDRSTVNIKPSPTPSYGTTHIDTAEVLHRQSYASSHHLPTFTTTHLAATAGALDTNSNTSETSVMSFLSAMESRSLQAGPVSASLLPPFRPPSWPAGGNPSTTELYLTGALPSTATFSSTAALISCPHTSVYPTRSYATNSPPALQDSTFSSTTNGLFSSHHDPLLHLKTSQAMLPAALAFSTPAFGSTLPVQSSTYRSAQESAPHLLQPQFSLLPCPLSTTHVPSQQYGATVFSGSIERALQRECSVIKHHQRPSTSNTATEQSPNSDHPLQGYFGSGEVEMSYQHEPSHHSPVSCSLTTGTDPSEGVGGISQAKRDSVSEAYPSMSVPNTKDDSLSDVGKDSNHNSHSNLTGGSPEHYSSSVQKQNSVIANKQSAQMSGLMASSSQTYVHSQSQSQSSCSSMENKTSPSPSSQSGSSSSVNHNHVYSNSQEQQQLHYAAQPQGLCRPLTVSESYPTPQAQGIPLMTYTSQSEVQASLTYPHSYATGQSLNSSYQTTSMHSLPTSNSLQAYSLGPVSGNKSRDSLSPQEAQSNTFALLPSSSLQALQTNITTSVQAMKPLGPMPQVSVVASAADSSLSSDNNFIYVVSKMEDHHKTQSVIRSSSHSGDQAVGQAHAKNDKIDTVGQQHAHLTTANGQLTASLTTTDSCVVSSHAQLNLKQTKLHTCQNKSSEEPQRNTVAGHTQFISIPSNQVLIEPSQMILLQQSLHNSETSSKMAPVQGIYQPQGLGSAHVQYRQMDRNLLGSNISDISNQHSSGCLDSKTPFNSKSHYNQATNHQLHDAKNHFTLNSICFSDSVLDERNILSNVDDILAATVAACGVQDFVKGSSSAAAELTKINSAEPKNQFQTIDMAHMSPSFSSTNVTSNSIAMTLKAPQMTSHCHTPSIHYNHTSDHQTDKDNGSCENNPSGKDNITKSSAVLYIKTEDGRVEDGDVQKKSLTKAGCEEDVKPAKRSGQAKRQYPRCTDISPPAPTNTFDSCPQQERIRQKIREVEEKQPEVKSGFIGSFLDFLKSGPKQHYSRSPTRTVSRTKKPCTPPKTHTLNLPSLPTNLKSLTTPLIPPERTVVSSQSKRLDEDLQRNLETLPSFSSDEEENTGKNQALRNSISSVLSSLDESSDRKMRLDNRISGYLLKPEQPIIVPVTITAVSLPQVSASSQQQIKAALGKTTLVSTEKSSVASPSPSAAQLMSVALEGLTDDELSDSGGEGMYRERDEFVVRNEDIESLKVTMKAGSEPPAIWKVQKALLQKFVPELRDGRRVFSATNSYLGYFGDAKTMYRRVYVKFLDTVNKREYVRVCSRKPRCIPMNSLRGSQVKTLLGLTATTSSVSLSLKPRLKQPKPRVEPPPKKRRKWKEEFSSQSQSGSSAEEDELNAAVPFTSRFLNTRTMKETFKGFVELLISVGLNEDLMSALERSNDELLLPHMKRVDGMITVNRKLLLHKLPMGNILKTALDIFPEIEVVKGLKKDDETPAFKIRLSGKPYNKKTMKPYKMTNQVPQEYTVDQQKTQCFSLYHSLQHYKYHTYLACKNEIESLRVQVGEMGQEETVQKCLKNGAWVQGLFDRFGELINQVQQACR